MCDADDASSIHLGSQDELHDPQLLAAFERLLTPDELHKRDRHQLAIAVDRHDGGDFHISVRGTTPLGNA